MGFHDRVAIDRGSPLYQRASRQDVSTGLLSPCKLQLWREERRRRRHKLAGFFWRAFMMSDWCRQHYTQQLSHVKATEVCRGIELSARADRKQPCKPSDLLSLPCEPSDSLSYRHSGCFLGSQMLQNLYLRTIIVDIHLRIEFVLVRDFSIFIDSI